MYDVILTAHVPIALSCIVAFWIPALARKGGRLHVLVGRYFVAAMTFVALTGMALGVMRLFDPSGRLASGASAASVERIRASGVFFLYLGTITLAPVLHGWRVVRTRRRPETIRTPADVGLLLLAILGSAGVVAAAFLMPGASRVLLLAMSPIGVAVGLVGLAYIRRPTRYRMGWWYAHAGAMIGGGIAMHTAAGIFVVGRWLAPDLRGWLQVVPWVLPTIVGVPVLLVVVRRAMRRFGDA